MKNILSYKPYTRFLGKEILEWAKFQIENKTSHMKQGQRILNYYSNLYLDREYFVFSSQETFSCGEKRKLPLVKRI